MASFTEKRIQAGERYAAAVRELREAFGELSVLDQRCGAPSFGQSPDVVPLRHPIFTPNLSGCFAARRRRGSG